MLGRSNMLHLKKALKHSVGQMVHESGLMSRLRSVLNYWL